MLSQTFAVLATFVIAATASPLSPAPRSSHNGFGGRGRFRNSGGRDVSFNRFGNSLNHFDDFHGVDNFSGFQNRQIVVEQSQTLVCRTIEVEVVQQRLAVIREFAKRIVTQQVCEVETQVVALQQFVSGCNDFQFDLHRRSGRQIGFDSSIASHVGGLIGSDGELSFDDLGFKGSDVGSSFVPVSGSNWVGSSSPASVGAAFDVAQSAARDSAPAGDITQIPVDSTPVLPPADGDNTAIPPPADGDNTAIPVNNNAAVPPPADGDNTAIPVNNAAVPPPADGDNTAIPSGVPDVPPPPPQASTCAGCSD